MNPVEIEEAVSRIAEAPFNPGEFPFEFLQAFGNRDVTIKRLRKDNRSDVPGAVLQRNNIHLAVCPEGHVAQTLNLLRESPKTQSAKARFLLATDGVTFEAEDRTEDEHITDVFTHLADRFGFFLPLAGITTVQKIKNNPIDVKATSRLNRLYVELLKENPDWATEERRHDMNHFMARLIFCFFAEDTGIFLNNLFTRTIQTMTEGATDQTHEVMAELFRTMDLDTRNDDREKGGVKSWARDFPYVNGNLFSGTTDCPKFNKLARTYLLRAGELNWAQINPDIFGSMIQAVADEGERGALGMHYTSVPNIRKVLNPLFLDGLREELEKAGQNTQKLHALKERLSGIRVFDPACGSGNFLVIAYKDMRDIQSEIDDRLKIERAERKSVIPLANFYGIEIRDFAVEIARLSLLIAEFQSDEIHIDQKQARLNVLPLKDTGHIICGNALERDWFDVCAPQKSSEIYICGNPPYKGSQWQSAEQKADLEQIFGQRTKSWKSLDYVAGWFMKAADYGQKTGSSSAFVSTNSICQGRQVAILWPLIFGLNYEISFAHTSFKWANLAAHNAGVTVAIIGIAPVSDCQKILFSNGNDGKTIRQETGHINAYLVPGSDVVVEKHSRPLSSVSDMDFGSMPNDGGHLLLSWDDVERLRLTEHQKEKFIKPVYGSSEYIRGNMRFCIWVTDDLRNEAFQIPSLKERFDNVCDQRIKSERLTTKELSKYPYKFGEVRQVGNEEIIAIPAISSENRPFLPVGVLPKGNIVTNKIYALYDAPLWNMALIASRLHWVWIGTVCVRMRTDFSYSNTLGWNTFPVPTLTEKNRADLTRCAEDILLAREAHFPATIADLYDPDKMPDNLRAAHDRNDEVLERIYIGRRFRNDTERLEKLFDLYSKMIAKKGGKMKKKKDAA
ncbi:class I SAM-dependent DNA methyltransferase [Acetobacter pasteurianus]|uniref:site-specific DNA-methyltransferase (adenine-specific) n=2 Tax=Acetobacter pasteurianus TaxID=438 RepID=C7JJB4_ACEP3|nr:DNA methyltransferase [Acetobacter pasteurianus]ASC07565.1 Putative DNA methyltransferase YeeA [Acetobacter pasteurianus subsp. pasteurianus]BAI01188.1 DNA methylase [Acetobacter pasteurianus IFO 3283-01]BAI04236.1 DNA methylase [Acetobacter pasteurianus IFO 3283-03]BAI07283.1 DNA methylase [Acetobacter pasteurianus IFO 3283-07]BAI10331.1 DNA methylase [Acetobacter pasteurianus IFO 3283-22]BAI13379.1 DNA methylase [Acetobacter pasteurianus IFO 3283-26]BAI16425.1 DNA methylase [Acetobacter